MERSIMEHAKLTEALIAKTGMLIRRPVGDELMNLVADRYPKRMEEH